MFLMNWQRNLLKKINKYCFGASVFFLKCVFHFNPVIPNYDNKKWFFFKKRFYFFKVSEKKSEVSNAAFY